MLPFVIPFMKWYYGDEVTSEILSDHLSSGISVVLDLVLSLVLPLVDLINVDLAPLVKYFAKINSFFPLDILFVDFGVVFGVWVTCLAIRAVINIAPTIGG